MPNIDFQNTEVAFSDKSNHDLRMTELLFKTIARASTIVKLDKFGAKVASTLHIPLGWALRPTIYQHFVGGETLEKSR